MTPPPQLKVLQWFSFPWLWKWELCTLLPKSWIICPLTSHPSANALSLAHCDLAHCHSWYPRNMFLPWSLCTHCCFCLAIHTLHTDDHITNFFSLSRFLLQFSERLYWSVNSKCQVFPSVAHLALGPLLNLIFLHSPYHLQYNMCLLAYFPEYKFQENWDTFFF